MSATPVRLSLEWIPAKDLRINHSEYQRTANETKVRKLVREWDWAKCANLLGNNRNGVVWVTNGGHRREAMMRINPDQPLPVVVSYFDNVRDEASQFLGLDDTKRLTAADKFKAELIEGNELAVAVGEILDKLGLSAGSAHVRAIAKFKTIVRTLGADALSWALTTAQESHPDGSGFHGSFVSGLAKFYARHSNFVARPADRASFIAKLQRHSVATWQQRADRYLGCKSSGDRVYKALVEEHDRGRRTNRIRPASADD